MSGIQIADAKAPFVTFETRAEEDRQASIEAGRFVARDVIYALITPHGSKDRIERVAEEWLEHMSQQAREGRLPTDWARAYRHAFEEFKQGRTIPLEGTPIVNWPMISPAQVKNLQQLSVLTVEVLAGANEELIKRLGMGGRDLVKKAQEYLKQAAGPGKDAGKIVALEQQVADLMATVEQLTANNRSLAAQVQAIGANTNPASVEAPDTTAGGLLDDEPAPARRKL